MIKQDPSRLRYPASQVFLLMLQNDYRIIPYFRIDGHPEIAQCEFPSQKHG